MWRLTGALALALAIALPVLTMSPLAASQSGTATGATAKPVACDDVFAMQVLLDTHGFSPGEIDGTLGANTRGALAAFQNSRGLAASGTPDCATLDALGGPDATILTSHTITAAEAQGPFVADIPEDVAEQKDLPALGYRSLVERLSERYHVSPAILTNLNPAAAFAAGETLTVPAVAAFDVDARPASEFTPEGARIEVTRDDSALRLVTADGAVLLYAPVTIGSEHDPLPLGTWIARGFGWMPPFQYNPELFWNADPSHAKATIAPGPNNPVGVVWIDINVDHYGLHGTPEPSLVGHAAS
ncbi:MAG: peptidoglycan-binding protein, partial [Vicinamibacterales bacterium]